MYIIYYTATWSLWERLEGRRAVQYHGHPNMDMASPIPFEGLHTAPVGTPSFFIGSQAILQGWDEIRRLPIFVRFSHFPTPVSCPSLATWSLGPQGRSTQSFQQSLTKESLKSSRDSNSVLGYIPQFGAFGSFG